MAGPVVIKPTRAVEIKNALGPESYYSHPSGRGREQFCHRLHIFVCRDSY